MSLVRDTRLITWSTSEGGWLGCGESGNRWQVILTDGVWTLGNQLCQLIARHAEARPLIEAATFSEAMWFANEGRPLAQLGLEFLLKARIFGLVQREAILAEMRSAGFDPSGMDGPREDWMTNEIIATQAAIDAFERAAVDLGWRPTNGYSTGN